jgi:hypothetical protein
MRVFVPTFGDPRLLFDGGLFLRYLAARGHEVILVSAAPLPRGPFRVTRLDVSPPYNTCPAAGLAYKRQWIEDHTDRGEWAACLDDGVRGVLGLDPGEWPDRLLDWRRDRPAFGWARVFGQPQTHQVAERFLCGLVGECVRVGTVYGSLTSLNAPFYRLKRHGYRAVAYSRFCVFSRDHECGRGHTLTTAAFTHDLLKSLRVVRKYGKVVTDRWAKPARRQSMCGGLGAFQTRLECMRADALLYMREFPDLIEWHPRQAHHVRFKKGRVRR